MFEDRPAQRVFNRFQDTDAQERVLTIDSQDSAILSLPWELLHDSSNGGVFLFRENPRISIRRKISGVTGGRSHAQFEPKDRMHLLFIVSRPDQSGFLDPRADSQAVLDAIEQYAPGRVTWEFLRPATINTLRERLTDATKPQVDILHFDGHGIFTTLSEEDVKQNPGVFDRSILSDIHKERSRTDVSASAVGLGFLLFEKEDGSKDLVTASKLGEVLHGAKVGLIVLSACQTATLADGSNPMASVAGRLAATGIPAVLAMSHSVLVHTTRALFGQFYKSLGQCRGIAASLDGARAYLRDNPGKYEVRRGDKREVLELQDWFLPTLYQGQDDIAMLTPQPAHSAPPVEPSSSNLRAAHEAGFFGRRRELWHIERWFAMGDTRRISITGFGGQGKTELALEAGRWLTRAGMFRRAVFVDYARVQSEDALSVAVSAIATVLETSLIDTHAATQALTTTPTLVILDNLEAVSADALRELLDAAVAWSNAGDSRMLLTSRIPDFNHPDYRIEGTRIHRRMALEGLGSASAPDDALNWFGELSKLPPEPSVPAPKRDDLINLFDRVQFHPLSIAVLAQQLKTRSAKLLGRRLEAILHEDVVSSTVAEGTPKSLIASLRLSLERLTEEERHAVRRLGVFQGGAFEDGLLAITQLGESGNERTQLQALLTALESGDPRGMLRMMGMELPDDAEIPQELLAQLTGNPAFNDRVNELRAKLASMPEPSGENLWPGLRRQLESAALIEAEAIPGVGPPFYRFHPTLAPMLWAQLDIDEKSQLTEAHRKRYYDLAGYLYREDNQNPHQARAVVLRELPNLLHAVRQALDVGDADAVRFVEYVNRFLNVFGMTREAASLTRRAEKAGGDKGSEAWYLAQSSRGEQLLASGQIAGAAEIFSDILTTLGKEPSYKLAVTLGGLGRCYKYGGRPDLAEVQHREGIAVTQKLAQSDQVKERSWNAPCRARGLCCAIKANSLKPVSNMRRVWR